MDRADDWCQKKGGCSRREHLILLCVTAARLNQKQLGVILHIDKSTIVDLTEEMQERGLVKKIRSRKDRRINIVEPTTKGQRAAEAISKDREGAIRHIFSPLPESAAVQMRDWALLIVEGLG